MMMLTPVEIQAIALSLRVALIAMVLCLPFALAVAWLLARRDFWGKTVLDAIVHLPLVLPPVAVGYLLLILLGRNGVLGSWLYETLGISIAFTWFGAAIASAVMSFPLMVRSIRLSIEAIDPRLETAARTLGATRFHTFRTITIPLMAPGILAGCVLGFARALGEFGATITFAGNIAGLTQTLPTALYTAHQMPDGDTAAIRLAILSIIIAISALIASEVLARRIRRQIFGKS
jgi:molybdate transport system permease protein